MSPGSLFTTMCTQSLATARKLRRIDHAVGRHDRRALVAAGRAGGQLGVLVMRDRFGIEHVEARRRARHIDPLSVVGDRQRMKPVLLLVLEISRLARIGSSDR